MREQNKTTDADADSSQPRSQPSLGDGEQRLFVHRIELRPDASARQRPVLIVDIAPCPR